MESEAKDIRDWTAVHEALAAYNRAAVGKTMRNLRKIANRDDGDKNTKPAEIAERMGAAYDLEAARNWWIARMRELYGETYRLVFDDDGLRKEYHRADLDSEREDIKALLANDGIWDLTVNLLIDGYPQLLEDRGEYPGGGPDTDDELSNALRRKFWNEFGGKRPACRMPEAERRGALRALMDWTGMDAITFDVLG